MLQIRSLPLVFHALPLVAAFMLPNLVTPIMEILRADIGFSSTVLTFIFVAYVTGLAPAFLFAPALATKFGRRRILVTAFLCGIASCIIYATAGSVIILLIARLLTGLCSGLTLVLGTVAIKEEATQEQRGTTTFLATMGIAIGLAGGPLLAGITAQFLPYPTKTVFLIEGILLTLALYVVWTQKETKRSRPDGWLPFKTISSSAGRVVLAGLGAFGPGMTAASIILALAPTILKEMGGAQGPFVAGLMAGGMYVVSPIAQTIARKYRSSQLIYIALTIILVSIGLLVVALELQNLWILGIAAGLIGAGQGISNLASFGLIHDNVNLEQVAGATSLLSLGTYASATCVPLIGGVLLDKYGLLMAGIGMTGTVAAMCLVGLLLGRESFYR